MSTSVDADIQREHAYQREHLEKTVSTLKRRLSSDNQHHHDDNVRIMQVRAPVASVSHHFDKLSVGAFSETIQLFSVLLFDVHHVSKNCKILFAA